MVASFQTASWTFWKIFWLKLQIRMTSCTTPRLSETSATRKVPLKAELIYTDITIRTTHWYLCYYYQIIKWFFETLCSVCQEQRGRVSALTVMIWRGVRPSSGHTPSRSSSSNKRTLGPPLSSSSKKVASSPRGRHAASATSYRHEYYEERKGRRGPREATRNRGGEDVRRRESHRGLEALTQVW